MYKSLRSLVMLLWGHSPTVSFNPSALGRPFTTRSPTLVVGHSRLGHPAAWLWWRWPVLGGEARKRELHRRVRRPKSHASVYRNGRHRKVKRVRFPSIPTKRERVRFEVVPANGWDRYLSELGCNATNSIMWSGTQNTLNGLLKAPYPCWLLPCKEDMAITIAQQQGALRKAGWKLLTCDPSIITTLCNKSSLRDFAEKIGQLDAMPTHWNSPADADYPCILKSAFGEHGKGTHIVESAEDVRYIAGEDLGSWWVLQELIPGYLEFSTSLLVVEGEIIDTVTSRYEYNEYAFVWPREVIEVDRQFFDNVPRSHLAIMSAFLKGYSGFCNFNYKVRPNGTMGIFEVNVRVGGDLACDVPRERARVLFEKLDELSEWEQDKHWQLIPPSLLNDMITHNEAIALYEQRCGWQLR